MAIYCIFAENIVGFETFSREQSFNSSEFYSFASIFNLYNLFFDEIISPGLTSIDQNLRKLAKEAINMADDLINDRKTKGKIVIEPRIVERESVGIKNENS